jgi:DNA polymerase-1
MVRAADPGAPDGAASGAAETSVRALLVDGHSLAFRAYFALPNLTSGDGRPTGALHGFLNMLRRLVEQERPTHVAVAFDRGRPEFRLEAVPAYKAQREAAPDDLRAQVETLRALLPGLGVAVVEAPGYEGDDILGTLARRLERDGEVLLVSGDRDLLQLVDERVHALFTRKGISDLVRWGPEEVLAEYGVPPGRLPEWKALAGDSSDNLPGVPGIGGKTASALLARVPSLDRLLALDLPELTARQRERLAEHADACRRQRDVATIRTDVPLDLDVARLAFAPAVSDDARALLEALEMRGILARWPRLGPKDGGAVIGGHGAVEPASQASQGATGSPTVSVGPSPAEVRATAVDLGEEVGVWAEVEGPPARRRLRRLGIWSRAGGHTFEGGDSGLEPQDIAPPAWRLLRDTGRPKVGVALKELWAWCAARGRQLGGPLLDLGVVTYLLDPGRSTYPPPVVCARLGGDADWPEDTEGRARRLAGLAEPARAALARDAMEALYWRIEAPLMPVLADMEEAGIAVDRDVLVRLGAEFAERLAVLEAHIHELAKGPFNLNSPRQLADVLFGRLGLPVVRRTKTGPSTDADVLQELAPLNPIVAEVLAHRQLQKLRSTYVEGMLPLIAPDGRLHTTFHQTVAATGRLSSADPNLQNIPIRLEEGRRVRAAFVAAPGMRLVAADYSQIELRVLAHLSGDPALRAAFAGGRDIHSETAAAVFGVGAEQVTSEMRRRAKAVNFGIVYGISAFGLARDLGIAVDEAQAFIDAYFERYPGVRRFLDDTVNEARARGYTLTPDGRRRYLPDLSSPRRPLRAFAERAAMNSPIQGTAADIIKRAMVAARAAGLPGRLLLQVHDELIFETPEADVAALALKARDVLERAMDLSVPLCVDVKVGQSWADAVPYDVAAEARAVGLDA